MQRFFACAVKFSKGSSDSLEPLPAEYGRRLEQDKSKCAAGVFPVVARARPCRFVFITDLTKRLLGLGGGSRGPEAAAEDEGPHPLRSEEWAVHMRIGWLRRRRKTIHIRFFRDGTLVTSEGRDGHWRLARQGVAWTVYMDDAAALAAQRGVPLVFTFFAELHWNAFGAEGRMFRGVVLRDRPEGGLIPPWLWKPVEATFHATGVAPRAAA
eukprot:GHVT01032728.1.p1 GENE.GHVT01032728.1~~GHVT01032728.1.p1  ORF type:complete len:211 (-),score=24.67 GHVT01032728.1:800-1432(-)